MPKPATAKLSNRAELPPSGAFSGGAGTAIALPVIRTIVAARIAICVLEFFILLRCRQIPEASSFSKSDLEAEVAGHVPGLGMTDADLYQEIVVQYLTRLIQNQRRSTAESKV
jgi:hypothetical protein